jgi:uncharacterized protein (DUF58 family)
MVDSQIKVEGVTVDIDDLINVRLYLSGLSLRSFHKTTSRGTQRSRVRGRGMEYEESRAYVAGDDVRAMDWRVMARTGEAHTKVYAEERERAFMLAIDLSPSMFFGTRFGFKSWAASQVAAHIGWLATFASERLGGLVASVEALYPVQPAKTRSGLMSLFAYLVESSDRALPVQTEGSQLNSMLIELRKVKSGSTLILISDFLGIDDATPELLHALIRQHDVTAIWIHDQTEIDEWKQGPYPVQIGTQSIMLDTSHSLVSDLLLQTQRNHRQKVEALTAQFNIPMHPVSCNQEITSQLNPVFRN